MSEKKHEVNEGAGITPEIAAELDKAAAEMAAEDVVDPSAMTRQYQADVGRSTVNGQTFARVDGFSASPKHSRHDVPYARISAAHPHLQSTEWEELLEYTYGDKSVFEAAAEDFKTFDPAKLEEVLAMGPVEVEDFLSVNLFADYDDSEADDEDDDSVAKEGE